MKTKRLLSILLIFILTVFSNFNLVYASNNSLAPNKKIEENHNHNKYTLISDETELESGNYYINKNISISKTITIKADSTVTLCLNGFNISSNLKDKPIIQVEKNAVFNIYSCNGGISSIAGTGTNNLPSCGIAADVGTNVNIEGEINIFSNKCGIIFNGNSLNLSKGVSIYNNKSSSDGGGIRLNSGSLTMDKTVEIKENTASNGGGIYCESSSTIVGGNITNNMAKNNGGGIYCASSISITDGNITKNIAKNFGGGVYSADTAQITGENIKGNMAINGGGAYLNGKNLKIEAKIEENIASNSGGGIYIEKNSICNSNSSVYKNSAKYGGGVYVDENSTYNESVLISNNKSDYFGGGVYLLNSNFNSFADIAYNQSKYGGGIYAYDFENIILNGTLFKNTAIVDGGGVYASSLDSAHINSANNIYNNTALNNGGAFYLIGKIEYTIEQGGLFENKAKNGGVIYTKNFRYSNDGNLIYPLVIQNTEKISYNNNKASNGAVFYMSDNTQLNISNADFNENEASSCGGVFYNQGIINANEITANKNIAGQGSVFYDGAGYINLSGENIFSENSTKLISGAVHINGGKFNLKDNTVFYNNMINQKYISGIFVDNLNFLNIAGELKNQSEIPIDCAEQLTVGNYLKVTKDWGKYMPLKKASDYFINANPLYGIFCSNGEIFLENPIIGAKKIELSCSELELELDEAYELSYKILPLNAINQSVYWNSNNPSVASVDNNGVITALSIGEAVITISTDSGLSACCTVTVHKKTVHHDESWRAFNDPKITENGLYYLEADINLSSPIVISAKNVTLCLNGFSINADFKINNIVVNENSSLKLCNCKETGSICGGKIGILNNGTLEINNININSTEKAGIYNENGSLLIKNSVITENDGYGIFLDYSNENDKEINIHSCKISDNKREGIFTSVSDGLNNAQKFKLGFDTIVTNNSGEYGGIYLASGVAAVISGLIADNNSCGIYVSSYSSVCFTERAVVQNNYNVNDTCNVLLEDNVDVVLDAGFLKNASYIGFTKKNISEDNNFVGVAEDRSFLKALSSDDQDYNFICDKDMNIYLALFTYGDINSDGEINMQDVTLLQRIIASIDSFENYPVSAKNASDVNNDGETNMLDVTIIQKYIAGLIEKFD